nr:MAG TPA: hypothetical protein [Caudoviricetes sp.]
MGIKPLARTVATRRMCPLLLAARTITPTTTIRTARARDSA